ncbi:hypothetical protein BDN72DRAFT_817420 [Pluteus cervinus]|uniref:Uncharacterized protein n=1 Tax=Pluteus cervinus TaxID=181527 RepID=A0ACD3B0G2_9AGAR|nr:hypothetical protein BDN72DRAFT_817420 [Pluteus cervinus]
MTVDLLVLGAGWTSTFLLPLCSERTISVAATSRTGRDSTIAFDFDPESDDLTPFRRLPNTKTVLIVFPITKPGGSGKLVRLYKESRTTNLENDVRFIQLGVTSVWDKPAAVIGGNVVWFDRHSPLVSDARALAESELLGLSPSTPTTVLNLAGLWGGQRDARNWVSRIAPTKEALKNKGALHLIHGLDVSRAILAVHANFDKASGQRWLLTDGRVYDWWDLASAWGSQSQTGSGDDHGRGPQAAWVWELMKEEGVRALPRGMESLGRALDSRDFWDEFGLRPIKTLHYK